MLRFKKPFGLIVVTVRNEDETKLARQASGHRSNTGRCARHIILLSGDAEFDEIVLNRYPVLDTGLGFLATTAGANQSQTPCQAPATKRDAGL